MYIFIVAFSNDSSGKTRNEFKGTISSQKIEFNKIKQEIKLLENKIELNLNNNKKIEMKLMNNNEIKEQIDYNINTIKEANKTANEIIDRNNMMKTELKRQGNALLNVDLKVGETPVAITNPTNPDNKTLKAYEPRDSKPYGRIMLWRFEQFSNAP